MERLKATLLDYLDELLNEDCIIAFSGGVDSTLLLKAACMVAAEKGFAVHAATFQTSLHPMQDLAITRKIALDLGVLHHILEVDELEQAGIMENPVTRCYLCKKYLFTRLHELGTTLGISLIMDGTNGDDLKSYRPGLAALSELAIKSPLAETGMTKSDVRKLAAAFNLNVADRPSSPCLATRFPYNTRLSYDQMRQVEAAEQFLHSLGFYNVRIRVHDTIARLEVDLDAFSQLLEQRDLIVRELKLLGYTFITLDLEGFRSGSMDYHLSM